MYMNVQHFSLLSIFVAASRKIPYIEKVFLFFIKFNTNIANITSSTIPRGIFADTFES